MPADSPSITDLTLSSGLSSDFRPLDQKSEFYVDSPQVCCSVKVTGVSENIAVAADWFNVSGKQPGAAGSPILHNQLVSNRDCYAGFTLPAPAGGFSGGDYRVDISVDGRPGAG
ncbi:MAG: hypothetical protein WC541_03805, partial [Dehalococcoidia bacterium]